MGDHTTQDAAVHGEIVLVIEFGKGGCQTFTVLQVDFS
jgi:hypothetical protein